MKELETKSDGIYKASAGATYPALSANIAKVREILERTTHEIEALEKS